MKSSTHILGHKRSFKIRLLGHKIYLKLSLLGHKGK